MDGGGYKKEAGEESFIYLLFFLGKMSPINSKAASK